MLKRLTRIDALTRPQHRYLRPDDEVYYFLEYAARQGYSHGPANQLIKNFKCEPEHRGTPRWDFKIDAISQVARGIAERMSEQALRHTTFVPVPPSKTREHPRYDDRCTEALRAVASFAMHPVDVRELVIQTESTTASHESDARLHAEDLVGIYGIDETLVEPAPSDIVVFDDVLTTGSHFKAMKQVLNDRFPGVTVRGVFVARRRI